MSNTSNHNLDSSIELLNTVGFISPIFTSNCEQYHRSVCGSILYNESSDDSKEIFSYLRHGRLHTFGQSLSVYHKSIIKMRNELEQSVLHLLTIHKSPYCWIRLVLMYECDPCMQDMEGYTAAHYAAESDDVEMLKALTIRFHEKVKIFSAEKINSIHENCLEALTKRNKYGLTVFMLCCYRRSMKCLDYLIQLKINDANIKDNCGDTCLHYAVSQRNLDLINLLINKCSADVNGGDRSRPSVLDIAQFNRDQQKTFDTVTDDSIQQILVSHKAQNRCTIRKLVKKRKTSSNHHDEPASVSKLACLGDSTSTETDIETARIYARRALELERQSDLKGAREYYHRAMNLMPKAILDWATCAFSVAIIHISDGENQLALELLEQALVTRRKYEKDSKEIDEIKRAIDLIR